MRKITNAELIACAKLAYEEGRLCAQGRVPNSYQIERDGKKYGCAIGVALNASEIEQVMLKDMACDLVHMLPQQGIIEFEDYEFAEAFQRTHDSWGAANVAITGLPDPVYIRSCEDAFKTMIGLPVEVVQ